MADVKTDIARKQSRIRDSLDRLSQEYQHYCVDELDWDWGCNIEPDTREILRKEYERRGIRPGSTGRGKRRE